MQPVQEKRRVGRLSHRSRTLHISQLPPGITLELLVELCTLAAGRCLVAAALVEERGFALVELASAARARYAVAVLDGTQLSGSALCVCLSAAPHSGGFDIVARPIAEGVDALALAHLFSVGMDCRAPLPSARLGVGAGGTPLAFVTFPTLCEAQRAVQLFHGVCSLGGQVLSVELARRHEGDSAAARAGSAAAWDALGGVPLPWGALQRSARHLPALRDAGAAAEAQALLAAAGAALRVDEPFARVLLQEALLAGAQRVERGLVAAARARWEEEAAAAAASQQPKEEPPGLGT